ncbi:MAG: hypothetical protein FWE32_06115 [Oscillospiraceae bacterium]|nr:hypothetical protein [Oscillospiraceae bacterium]
MANSSAAYDLSAFAPEPSLKPEKKQQLRVFKNQSKAFATALTPRVLTAFAIIITLASLIIYNQVALNEVTREVNHLNSQLAILESESIRYASLLESTVSLRAVAQQAEEMGMVRLDQYRTVHVSLFENDRIVLFGQPEETAPAEGLLAMFASIISGAMEYISRS